MYHLGFFLPVRVAADTVISGLCAWTVWAGLVVSACGWLPGVRHGVMGRRTQGGVVLAAAAALAGVGGSVAGLGAPAWLAGAVVGVSALAAGVMADRGYAAREERAAAQERLDQVLDELRETVPASRGDVLGLLQAGRSPMPFRGRTRELTRLAAWRDDSKGSPVLVLGGPGGVGKSRLALEFGSRVPPRWAAGWLHAGAGSTAVEEVRAGEQRALILVEDADGRDDLAALLESLAGQPAEPPIRVILLTRSPEGLQAALGQRLEERHAWIAAGAVTLELEDTGAPDDWERWYGEAVAAFAAALGRPAPAVPGHFAHGPETAESFVVLQAQALLAVLGAGEGDRDPRELPFGQVMAALMGHEQRWWRAVAARWEWSGGGPPALAVQERCLAALALLGADSAAEAGQVLRRVPELGDALTERLSAVASWALELYPAEDGLVPRIRPDLVGDWFVVTRLAEDSALTRSLCSALTDDQAARALGFLARAADASEEAGRLFSEFAAGDIRRIILAAAQAARAGRVGRPLLDAVIAAELLRAGELTLDQLSALTRLAPPRLLVQTHAAIAVLTVTAYRQLAADDSPANRASLAWALDDSGYRLDLAGRYQDALTAAEEAVTFFRRLAADNPAAYQADLASVLDSLGVRLDRLGRYQDALTAVGEAVTFFRRLAADDPLAYQADLANALNSLGIRLGRLGRYQDALTATVEAVTIRRRLAADNPAAYQADLATALNNLGADLDEVGRYQDALLAAEEAVIIRRQLAADDPPAHQASLAMALYNLGLQLERLGGYQDALLAVEEAVTIRRRLAADNPPAYQADLARALNNLGVDLDRVSRYEDSLQATEEAVIIRRQLVADNPAVHQPGLAQSLNNLGAGLDRQGRYEDALIATERAVIIRRQLAADNPAVHQPGLAQSLNGLGIRLDRLGRYQDAVLAAEEAVALYRQLAAGNPAVHQPGLADALNSLGIRLGRVGRHQDALTTAEEAVALYRQLAAGNPAVHQPGLAEALNRLGNRLDRLGFAQEMLTARAEAVRTYREMATRDPDLYQAEYQRQLSDLRREYDHQGMTSEAIAHDLLPGKNQPPETPS